MGMRSSALTLMLMTLGLLAAAPARAASVSVSWDTDAITTTLDDRGWLQVAIPGGHTAAEPGEPDLPRITVVVPLRPGEGVSGWQWTPEASVIFARGVDLAPAPELHPGSLGGSVETAPKSTVYEGAGVYPTEAVRFLGVQTGRGESSATFAISPFSWNPATGDLVVTRGGVLQVETGGPSAPDVLGPSLRDLDPSLPSTPDRDMRSSRVTESSGRLLYSLAGGLRVPDAPSVEGMPVEFIVVTPEALAPGFEPLVAWKNRTGSPAVLRTTEWIYENYPHGADNGERIRLFLRDAYQYWGAQTVLLGGDPDLLPIRYARNFAYNSPEGTNIATDYYYACLDGTWNADGDDRYGEASVRSGGTGWANQVSDVTDLRPELHVGRIPANDLAQVQSYVSKYLAYVRAPAPGAYLSRVLTMGEVLFESNWTEGNCDVCSTCPDDNIPCASRDGADDCIELIQGLQGTPVGPTLNFVEMYERDYWWVVRGRPAALDLNLPDVLAQLNQGVMLAFHSGHGDRDRWAIGRDRVTASNLAGLTNAASSNRYTGMVYAINCNSAAVDYDCAAESFVFAPSGGGLVYVGSTNLDFPSVARTMQRSFFSRWPGDGTTIPGAAYYEVMDSVGTAVGDTENHYRFLLNSLTYIGDPDMPIWTGQPQTMQVAYDATLEVGPQEVTVSVMSGSTPLQGARVAFLKEGDALAVGLTNASGNLVLPFAPKAPGSVLVTVTHPRGLPFEGTATIGPRVGGGFLSLDSFTIEDDGPLGNGNGRLEFGETADVGITYTNHGDAAVPNGTAGLSLQSAHTLFDIDVLDGEETLPAIAAGATATVNGAFRVRIAAPSGLARAELTDRELVELELTWNDGTVHTETLTPNAYRSDLVLYQTHFNELIGDLDGQLDSGDQFEVVFDVLNQGSGTASGVVVELAGTGITVVSANFLALEETPQYQVGSTAPLRFNVTNANPSLTVRFYDGRSFPRQQILSRGIDAVAPGAPQGLTARGLQDRVSLRWLAPSVNSDLFGYRIYRSDDESGPFQPVGVGIIERTSADADSGYYSDEGLPALSRFFYQVASVDRSGNESVPTAVLGVNTAPGFASGWPVVLSESNGGAPTIAQLNHGGFEIIFGTDVIYAFTAGGEDYYDGDQSPSTRGRLTDVNDGFRYPTKPAVADLDGDGEPEIIAASWHVNDDPANTSTRQIYLTAFDRRGNVFWKSPFLTGSPVISAPAVGDIDGDGLPEVVILASRFVYAFNGENGTRVGNNAALREVTGSSLLYGSVSLGDIDTARPGEEICFVTKPTTPSDAGFLYVIHGNDGSDVTGFPFSFSNAGSSADGTNSSPAIADVDGDGKLEVFVTSRKRLWMFNPDPTDTGNDVGWWAEIGQFSNIDYPNPSPALGDLDRDGDWEVAVGGANGRLHVYDAVTGQPVPAFTTSPSEPWIQVAGTNSLLGSPIIGDLTNDGRPEVIIGDNGGFVHVYEYTGQPVSGFPYVHGGQFGPGLALWDTDKDGHPNLVLQSNQIQTAVVLDFPNVDFDSTDDAEIAARYPWPMFRHDQRNRGHLVATEPALPILLSAPELSSSGGLEVDMVWVAGFGFEQFRIYRRPQAVETWDLVGTYPAIDVQTEGGDYRTRDVVASEGTYVYRIGGLESDGTETLSPERSIELSTGPQAFRLHPARPNPYRTSTHIRFDLPKPTVATVQVVDPTGRVVRVLLNGEVRAGTHNINWDGRDDDGRELGAGVYFIRAQARGVGESANKIIRLR